MTLLVKKQKVIVIRKYRQAIVVLTKIFALAKISFSTKTIISTTTKSKLQKRQHYHENDIDFIYRDEFIYH